MEKYYKQFENCRQWEKPYCTDQCPFHLDVLDFQAKMSKNRYNAAYKTMRNAVAFPDIVAAACPEYCGDCCPRKDIDRSVQLNLLEKTCVAKAARKRATEYNLPIKEGKVAIIGAGISGLACALRLASKKYDVTIFEKTDRFGGQLWDILDPDIFLEDIKRQFEFENYALHLNTEVEQIEELQKAGFHAVYVATGEGGNGFGALQDEHHCITVGTMAVFAGGSITGKDVMYALADGLDMAWAVEVYLKTGKLQYPQESAPSKVVVNPNKFIGIEPVAPTENGIFTDEETKLEAARCIRCQCDDCKTYCDIAGFLNKWPLEMRDEIMTTTMASESLVHKNPAVKLINMCTQCDLCNEVCPGSIQLGRMIKTARRRLHKQNKMPGAYHQFWLKDMDFSNGALAAVCKTAPGTNQCKYAFFPGCHLGAANPAYVLKPYGWLLSKQQDIGLFLRCCGVPADWAGNEEMLEQELSDMRSQWENMGKPTLIMACPSCMRHVTQYLPEIQVLSLYAVFAEWGLVSQARNWNGTYSIFDPCSARNDQEQQDAVRQLASQAGIKLEELPEGDKHGCCGFGGNVSVASEDFAEYVVKERGKLSENPYISYCINCRDVFCDSGKKAVHILDVLFDVNTDGHELPNLTERRQNRMTLKKTLLKEIWSEEMEEKPRESKLTILIPAEIQSKMDSQKLVSQDVEEVLEFGESAGRRAYNPEKDTYQCYKELGFITCWVEYQIKGDTYLVTNVFTHRMKIELEAVWNGKKTGHNL